MDNLNDNINLEFLSNKLQKFGEWDSLVIDYHPVTKKHLGLARVMFKLVGSAVACVAALHGRSMMGKQVGESSLAQSFKSSLKVNCYLDPRGLMATKMFEELTTERQPSPEPEVVRIL